MDDEKKIDEQPKPKKRVNKVNKTNKKATPEKDAPKTKKVKRTKVKTVEKPKDLPQSGDKSEKIQHSEDTVKKTPTHNKFSLMDEIKNHPLYKRSSGRDEKAREELDLAKKDATYTSKNSIFPGQMVLFKYLNPKTKEELEFYDASPCTIFFGVFNSKEGKRVLGFNVHYFPPKLRYIIMNKIYEMYKPVYQKYFETGLSHEMDAFDYHYLINELERQNLSWAVRMYIPTLIGDTFIIPPAQWPTALMTEGWFKKDTRAHIMQLFKGDAKKHGKISVGTHSHGKRDKKHK